MIWAFCFVISNDYLEVSFLHILRDLNIYYRTTSWGQLAAPTIPEAQVSELGTTQPVFYQGGSVANTRVLARLMKNQISAMGLQLKLYKET